MNDDRMKEICAALSSSKCIRQVYFHRCGNKSMHLTVLGANYVAGLLRDCESIEGIHLRSGHHQITDEGAINIAQAVSDRRGTTRKLSLSGCGFGNEGGMVLRRLLDAPTSTLESLDVGCNPFDPSLSKSFATCLQNSSVLRHLDIGGAREGWKVSTVVDVQIHLVCALRDNQLLRRLNVPHIGNRTIREEQKALRRKVFREVLQVNHSLIELSGYNNGWFERNMLWMIPNGSKWMHGWLNA